MLGILRANREMENGDSEPADPDQQDASRQLPDRFTNAQRQRCNEDASNGNYKQRTDSSSDEERQLLCSLIFFLHNDFSTHIFACPPRQQVPELQVTAYLFRSIKCNDQMENGRLAHVIRHVA